MKAAAASAERPLRNREGFDLLRLPLVRRVVLRREFPVTLQLLLLAGFIALTVLAWGTHPPAGTNAKLFAKSHLTTLLIWGLWWPAMVWVAVLFGRVWCAVCPLELVGDITERLARRIGVSGRPLPRWIVSGTVMVALYALIQLLVAGVQLHRVPAYTAWFLLALLLGAALAPLVFRDRPFCRGFCPVGLLLGTYGRGGMLAVRPAPSPPTGTTPPDARTCPSLLNPSRLNSNQHCLLCAQCIKARPAHMRLLVRAPFSPTDDRPPLASWPITAFVILLSGFVLGELFSEWPAGQKHFLAAPRWFAATLHLPAATGWLEGLWMLAAAPLTLWTSLAVLLRLTGERHPIGTLWRQMALPIAVLVAAAHMSKALAKFTSWGPFLAYDLRDPAGATTATAIARESLVAPASWLPLSALSTVGLLLVASALLYAIRERWLAAPPGTRLSNRILPYLITSVGFAALIAAWRPA